MGLIGVLIGNLGVGWEMRRCRDGDKLIGEAVEIWEWVCFSIVTSLNPLRAIYSRQNFATITVHIANRVLLVPLKLVEVLVSWSEHTKL